MGKVEIIGRKIQLSDTVAIISDPKTGSNVLGKTKVTIVPKARRIHPQTGITLIEHGPQFTPISKKYEEGDVLDALSPDIRTLSPLDRITSKWLPGVKNTVPLLQAHHEGINRLLAEDLK